MSEQPAAGPGPVQPGPASGLPPPDWYPDPTNGQLRWWDGRMWGVYASLPPGPPSTTDPKTVALVAHVTGIFGFLGPLIVYLVVGDRGDPFARHHAAEALNFHLTVMIAMLVGTVTCFFGIGLALILAAWVCSIVFSIMGAVAANRGEWYRYPISIRMVSGAVGG